MIFSNPFPNYVSLFNLLDSSNSSGLSEKDKIKEYYKDKESLYGNQIVPFKKSILSQITLKGAMNIVSDAIRIGALKEMQLSVDTSDKSDTALPRLYIPVPTQEHREKTHKERLENIQKMEQQGIKIDDRCRGCHSAGCGCSRFHICNGNEYFSEDDYMLGRESPTVKLIKGLDPSYIEVELK